VRDWKVARAIIHAHNIYSHDACDGKPWYDPADPTKECDPWVNDPKCVPDEQCVKDMRDGICKDAIDAFFLSDHGGTLADENTFDKLYIQRGDDKWVTEGGIHTGSQVACANGNRPILMVGSENNYMPIGFVKHPAGDAAARHTFYGREDNDAMSYFNGDAEGIAAQMHSEEQPVDHLRGSVLKAMEIYNFHVSILGNIAKIAEFVTSPDTMPPTDFAFMALYEPLMSQLTKWYSTVYARDITAFMGTDIHRNVAPNLLPDGERFDSYRRFIRWFSNYLLVKEFAPSAFKDAVKKGRVFVVAEGIGSPTGFDFYAETAGGIVEAGTTVAASASPKLVGKKPTVYGYNEDPKNIKLVLKKIGDGTAEVVKEYTADFKAEGLAAGVYYLEAHLTPEYMRPFFGVKYKKYANEYIHDFTWIYSNAIRIQ
jgi:hypothetical protein